MPEMCCCRSHSSQTVWGEEGSTSQPWGPFSPLFPLFVCRVAGGKTGDAYGRLNESLHSRLLKHVRLGKRVLQLQRHDPEEGADAEGEDGAEDDEDAAQLEPAARGGDEAGQHEDEGDEDGAGVDDAGGQRKAVVEQVARGLGTAGGLVRPLAANDEAEAELNGAGEEEQGVGHNGGEQDSVDHGGGCCEGTNRGQLGRNNE